MNIVPNKQEGGQDSTNIVGTVNNAVAKKYMFSIENLAWRTSNTPGFSTSDLPVCERGPNGGRVMWFPPYDLTFSESVSANWNPTEFLGRPEPIYTYKNTSRTGTLAWKIVVDHPSILNVIVNKVLGNETNRTRVDSILESFFAGCRKYDIYELAKKYVTINPNDLFELQQAITSKELTREQLIYTRGTIETGFDAPNSGGGGQPLSQEGGGGNTDLSFKDYEQLGFYFGNDIPNEGNDINYTTEYNRYTTTDKETYKTKPNSAETQTFFNTVVTPNYNAVNDLAIKLGKAFETNTEGTVTIEIDASCSAPASIGYNLKLSERRVAAMIKFFAENPNTQKYMTSSPQRLIVQKRNALGEQALSEPKVFNFEGLLTNTPPRMGKIFNCTDEDPNIVGGDTKVGANEVYTVGAMACRRAFISTINSQLKTPQTPPSTITVPGGSVPLFGTVVTTTEIEPVVTEEWKPRDNITKRVVRALLTECDYFETIKETTPMVYDNLKDKLKFFQPAFHSITPEGLNSRLTFLQQCMRPGDTIPTVKQSTPNSNPELQYNNATNTSFGAPPVLVLRVGDFYNTKIIPTSLGITYEGLDINPEGIGVQPMIATINMSFNFVGGSGLKESVDKLQNALTFNYYANTEIYDDRADVTDLESSRVLDQIFLAGQTPPPIPGTNNTPSNSGQNNNSAIGNVVSSSTDTSGVTTGVISYSAFMDKVVSETQTYFTNVVNKSKETVNQYNNAVRQQWMLERNYTNGNLLSNEPAVLFGKPNNVEKRFDEIFIELEKNIKDGNEGFIQYVSEPSKNLPASVIRTLKENYFNLVSRKRGSFQNGISSISQSLVNQEQSYIQTLGRVNTIVFDPNLRNKGTDGLQANNGPVTIYITSGTTDVHPSATSANTFSELVEDIQKIELDIRGFNAVIQSKKTFTYPANNKEYEGILVFETFNDKANNVSVQEVFKPFSDNQSFGNESFRRVYMIVSDDVIDEKKYETFKQQMIGNIIGNTALLENQSVDLEGIFDTYWIRTVKPIFLEENNITKSFIENLEKNDLKNYLIYTPFDAVKQRNLTFTTENSLDSDQIKTQENLIKGLASTTNQNTNVLTWNDQTNNDASAYISKAKLN